jgi:hypothetical protein
VHWTLQDEHPIFGSMGSKPGDACPLQYDRYSRNFVVVTRHWFQ